MILAAAAHARKAENPPPRELKLAWQSKNWGVLPNAGGLRDQRIGELERMAAALNAYNAYSAFLRSNNFVEFHRNHPRQMEIVTRIIELQKAADG
jgi:hypothetical protein